MSTILRLNGQSYVVVGGVMRRVQPVVQAKHEELPEPLPTPPPEESGTVWTDAHGVQYRKIQEARREDNWIRPAVLAKWLGVELSDIRGWIADGLLDAAVVIGTVVPLCRVRDPARLKEVSTAARSRTSRTRGKKAT